jgi:hypothetical protein
MQKTCFAFLMCAAFPIGCGDDIRTAQPDAAMMPMPDSPPMTSCTVTPGAWSAPSFEANTTTAMALRAQIDLLVGSAHMRGAEEGLQDVVIDEVSDLEAIYDGGTPALSAHVHAGFDPVMDDVFAEFVALIAAGPRDLVTEDGWDPGEAGGIYGARKAGFNTGGIEVRQIADKGLFGGGALYSYALKLTGNTIDEATIDAIAAAWGSNATLDPATKTDSANYSHGMGFHAKIAKSLADAKAYAADPDCTAERDAAIVAVFRQWELSLFARALFYGNDAVNRLIAAGADDDLIASALHFYAEGIGLLIGFHGLPHPTTGPLAGAGRTATDADIDAILAAYAVDRTDLEASTIGTAYVADTEAFQTGVTSAEAKVKQVYGLSDAEITSFRSPTAG